MIAALAEVRVHQLVAVVLIARSPPRHHDQTLNCVRSHRPPATHPCFLREEEEVAFLLLHPFHPNPVRMSLVCIFFFRARKV